MAERVGDSVQVAVVALGLVTPDDGGGVGSVERVAQSRFGVLTADGGTVDEQLDDFAAFGRNVAGELVAFQLHLGGDARKGGVDELVGCRNGTSSNSCNSSGSEVSPNAMSVQRRQATFCPMR